VVVRSLVVDHSDSFPAVAGSQGEDHLVEAHHGVACREEDHLGAACQAEGRLGIHLAAAETLAGACPCREDRPGAACQAEGRLGTHLAAAAGTLVAACPCQEEDRLGAACQEEDHLGTHLAAAAGTLVAACQGAVLSGDHLTRAAALAAGVGEGSLGGGRPGSREEDRRGSQAEDRWHCRGTQAVVLAVGAHPSADHPEILGVGPSASLVEDRSDCRGTLAVVLAVGAHPLVACAVPP
jgi:hypothetical protein